tara:strand:+ start:1032 stop:1460 length:429 start_codon:yes stop_codon:yes gene_type:complete
LSEIVIISGDKGLSGDSWRLLEWLRVGASMGVVLAHQADSDRLAVVCAACRSRLSRRMYNPRARKLARTKRETLTEMAALAPSESWEEGGRSARAILVGLEGFAVGGLLVELCEEVEKLDAGVWLAEGIADCKLRGVEVGTG